MPRIIKLAKGSYTAADVTVDSSGRVITASSGSAGGAMVVSTSLRGPASGTHTTNGNWAMAYAASGGGGGGGRNQGQHTLGGIGGAGAWGIYSFPTGSTFSQPYTVGSGGSGGSPTGNGQAGQATTIANIFTINAGAAGNAAPTPNPGPTATAGNAPGALTNSDGQGPTETNAAYAMMFGQNQRQGGGWPTPSSPGTGGTGGIYLAPGAVGRGGIGGTHPQSNFNPTSASGQSGAAGVMILFENIGA